MSFKFKKVNSLEMRQKHKEIYATVIVIFYKELERFCFQNLKVFSCESFFKKAFYLIRP